MPQPQPPHEPHLRAADTDRAAVAEVLGGHMSAGRLTVAEYDDRLARAYAARTYGELAELTVDLPAPAPVAAAAPAPQPVAATGRDTAWDAAWMSGWHGGWAGNKSLRAAWASWLTTAVIVIGIWALTSVGSGEVLYPWPVWVVGPWGVVLLAQSLGAGPGRGRDRQRDRSHRSLHG